MIKLTQYYLNHAEKCFRLRAQKKSLVSVRITSDPRVSILNVLLSCYETDRLEFCRVLNDFFHIGVWTFAQFVGPLLATILSTWEIWSPCVPRTSLWPETGDFFGGGGDLKEKILNLLFSNNNHVTVFCFLKKAPTCIVMRLLIWWFYWYIYWKLDDWNEPTLSITNGLVSSLLNGLLDLLQLWSHVEHVSDWTAQKWAASNRNTVFIFPWFDTTVKTVSLCIMYRTCQMCFEYYLHVLPK